MHSNSAGTTASFYTGKAQSQAAQKRHEETHQQMREEFWTFMRETSDGREEALRRLDLILEKLVDRPN